ncbi:hypothetical protein [Vibrio ostreicida]|uniref:hypothetical protein n=1 Tax=Vibrio ostreicida TaxID=526588 RepID=UPI000970805A|nr:hypothetical protein [Vibrio ostreicida]
MTEPTMERINQCLAQANFSAVAKIKSYFQIWEVIDAILEDSNFSEETNFERIRVLLRAGILTEVNVLEYYNSDVEDMDLSYEHCPLVKVLAPLERDGTLYLSDSEAIYQLSWDLYLDYIKSIVLLGGRVDHDGLLYRVFDGRSSFNMFNYLMDNFDFKQETINSVAGALIDKIYWAEGNADIRAKAAFEKLIEKGIDINLPYEESDGFYDYRSFLGVVFCYEPDVFEQYLALSPDRKIIDNMNWRFMLQEHDIDERHIDMITKMVRLGYPLPLNEIVDWLESCDFMDLAHIVSQLAH